MTDPITFTLPAWVFVGWIIWTAIDAALQLRHTHYLKQSIRHKDRELDAIERELRATCLDCLDGVHPIGSCKP